MPGLHPKREKPVHTTHAREGDERSPLPLRDRSGCDPCHPTHRTDNPPVPLGHALSWVCRRRRVASAMQLVLSYLASVASSCLLHPLGRDARLCSVSSHSDFPPKRCILRSDGSVVPRVESLAESTGPVQPAAALGSFRGYGRSSRDESQLPHLSVRYLYIHRARV